ncbi:MAG: hypothetical protein KGQ49_04730, partial [Verrucomicrobia bacterium]|nr:hypothetical protein [Verrucomicrobiota bacterium]
YWYCVRIHPEDPAKYEQLMLESFAFRTHKTLEHEPAYQTRQGVQKDIWTNNETRHFQIQSRESGLWVHQKKDKFEAVETLEEIRCQLPNDFTLCANEGVYTYPSHHFVAQKNCLLEQRGNRVAGTRIDLDLDEASLHLENPSGLIEGGRFRFTAKELTWEKDSNLLHLIDDVCIKQQDGLTFLSHLCTVQLQDDKPTLMTLQGNVRLIASQFQGKESYAMADRLTYNPLEKTFLFGADRRVLFWQDGLTLSAPEVLIRRDEAIEGHGEVHFTFDLDEQNCIDDFFKQYL